MSMPLWVSETAAAFWAAADEPELFPRNLRRSIAHALPRTLVLLPQLRWASVDTWLRNQHILCGMSLRDRALRACLVARYGHGCVFLDGTDPDDEQRFSLAHELAHFLRDYWHPRRVASERLGPEVLAVFDEGRPARYAERVHALLGRAPLGFDVHLMERTVAGHFASAAIDTAEHDADRLAFELLAPSATVLQTADRYPPRQRRGLVEHQLTSVYGLPAAPATHYAALLIPPSPQTDSLVHRLRLVR